MSTNHQFKEVGYLSEQSLQNDVANTIRASKSYQAALTLNKLGQTILNHSHIHPDDEKEVYLILHFQRLLSHYQAIILMTERGMLHQAEVLTRCLLETFINLVSYHLNDDFLAAMTVGDDQQKRQILTNLYTEQKQVANLTKGEMQQLEALITSNDHIDREEVKVFMKAEMAGLINEYRTTYQILSESVHSCLHSLSKDLERDEIRGSIIGINACTEQVGELQTIILVASDYMADATDIILQRHKQPIQQSEFEALRLTIKDAWQGIVTQVSHR